jgi:nucleoid DNA-binding protein
MPKTYYNRAQIIKKIAPQVGLTQVKTSTIIKEMEDQIVKLGKERGRVIITGLGSFKFYIRKSTTIKQIRTKKTRVVMPQRVVRFISTETLKEAIRGGKSAVRKSPDTPRIPLDIQDKSKHRIHLEPSSYFEPISKDRFHQILQKRLGGLGKRKNQDNIKKYADDTPEGKLISSILKLARNRNCDSVNFIFEKNITYIFYKKPRELIGKLSNNLCQRFFANYFDLSDFDIPQERVGLLEFRNKNCGIMIMNIHLLPTENGASIVVKFKIK